MGGGFDDFSLSPDAITYTFALASSLDAIATFERCMLSFDGISMVRGGNHVVAAVVGGLQLSSKTLGV